MVGALDGMNLTQKWLQATSTLDRLRFTPITQESSFEFVDPADVIRACHIVPMFRRGLRHTDGIGLSPCSNDSKDWASYYINRYVLLVQIIYNTNYG